MKRITFLPLFLALLLTGCGAPADGPVGSSAVLIRSILTEPCAALALWVAETTSLR